jgi:hypothetical protein
MELRLEALGHLGSRAPAVVLASQRLLLSDGIVIMGHRVRGRFPWLAPIAPELAAFDIHRRDFVSGAVVPPIWVAAVSVGASVAFLIPTHPDSPASGYSILFGHPHRGFTLCANVHGSDTPPALVQVDDRRAALLIYDVENDGPDLIHFCVDDGGTSRVEEVRTDRGWRRCGRVLGGVPAGPGRLALFGSGDRGFWSSCLLEFGSGHTYQAEGIRGSFVRPAVAYLSDTLIVSPSQLGTAEPFSARLFALANDAQVWTGIDLSGGGRADLCGSGDLALASSQVWVDVRHRTVLDVCRLQPDRSLSVMCSASVEGAAALIGIGDVFLWVRDSGEMLRASVSRDA